MINICFHGIGRCAREREAGESRYWITEERFSEVLDVVVDQPHVRLSFDDGNASDIEVALPALLQRGLTATFFIVAGRLEDRDSVTIEGLKQLRRAGMTIGSHGWEHIPWRHLSAAQQHKEFVEARAVLASAIGRPVDQAALPLGRFDRGVLAALKNRGYRSVYSSDRLPARPGAWLQGRFSVTKDDTPDTIRAIVGHRLGIGDSRDLLASLVKRVR
ncbi:polysaccharide deacetylase family protein [Microlunatus sp. Gsoil 973]|uniref:polysaccharide deacetylase family protein n=1 Tax=Microlunatus sp. Gsoil 973 TaxID=2672569 RepID=UPI0012B4D21C|nr:polysaccharide deacetylase family protein [Microlunatus sp. Gsoil 973]QGN33883.1 polysaccharide deacetylase family protein [Microlunatus sp. Gsoil 973]